MTVRTRLKHGYWAIVLDAKKAIVLENIGDHMLPDLRCRSVWARQDKPDRAFGPDAPGRVMHPTTPARSSVERVDHHELAEHRFLEDVVRRLDLALRECLTSGLVIVAPPRALGHLRKSYTSSVREALRAEIDSDLTHLPTSDLEREVVQATLLKDTPPFAR
jgi:protein required for attachment to host cells